MSNTSNLTGKFPKYPEGWVIYGVTKLSNEIKSLEEKLKNAVKNEQRYYDHWQTTCGTVRALRAELNEVEKLRKDDEKTIFELKQQLDRALDEASRYRAHWKGATAEAKETIDELRQLHKGAIEDAKQVKEANVALHLKNKSIQRALALLHSKNQCLTISNKSLTTLLQNTEAALKSEKENNRHPIVEAERAAFKKAKEENEALAAENSINRAIIADVSVELSDVKKRLENEIECNKIWFESYEKLSKEWNTVRTQLEAERAALKKAQADNEALAAENRELISINTDISLALFDVKKRLENF